MVCLVGCAELISRPCAQYKDNQSEQAIYDQLTFIPSELRRLSDLNDGITRDGKRLTERPHLQPPFNIA